MGCGRVINGDGWQVQHGSCLDVLPTLPDSSVDSIVTDPPYELAFMGKKWDSTGVAFNPDVWRECLRVLKPGGYLLAFGGSRTWHRLTVAIEDAGFEIRDSIAWIYGSGFPKSLDVSKAIESTLLNGSSHSTALRKTEQDGDGDTYQLKGRNNGMFGEPRVYDRKEFAAATPEAKQWQGWGTALKPAFEPIVVARKPLTGTVAANVLEWGTGGLNIDGTRIPHASSSDFEKHAKAVADIKARGGVWVKSWKNSSDLSGQNDASVAGRWPANVMLDEFTAGLLDEQTDASRFFYVAKASKRDRNEGLDELEASSAADMVDRVEGSAGMNSPRAGAGRTSGAKNFHPTVKPTDLMRQLVRLVTPPGGTVLDPFTGSGSTGKAAILERFNFVGIELTEDYLPIIEGRLNHASSKHEETLF